MLSRLLSSLRDRLESPEDQARRLGVTIGRRCVVSSRRFGSEPYLVELGDHVHVTTGVRFVTHDGAVWVGRDEDPTFDVYGRIKIGDNTYLGNDALILPGVTIGRDCVVGACSVVTKSIPDGTVVAGNPARFICSTADYLARMRPFNAHTKGMARDERDRAVKAGGVAMIVRRMLGRG